MDIESSSTISCLERHLYMSSMFVAKAEMQALICEGAGNEMQIESSSNVSYLEWFPA